MDAHERQWRERLIEAANNAADELRAGDPFYHREMIEALEGLSSRLTGELGESPGDEPPGALPLT